VIEKIGNVNEPGPRTPLAVHVKGERRVMIDLCEQPKIFDVNIDIW
jgi:hypothetical protein